MDVHVGVKQKQWGISYSRGESAGLKCIGWRRCLTAQSNQSTMTKATGPLTFGMQRLNDERDVALSKCPPHVLDLTDD
jgi:hypothetical protein